MCAVSYFTYYNYPYALWLLVLIIIYKYTNIQTVAVLVVTQTVGALLLRQIRLFKIILKIYVKPSVRRRCGGEGRGGLRRKELVYLFRGLQPVFVPVYKNFRHIRDLRFVYFGYGFFVCKRD